MESSPTQTLPVVTPTGDNMVKILKIMLWIIWYFHHWVQTCLFQSVPSPKCLTTDRSLAKFFSSFITTAAPITLLQQRSFRQVFRRYRVQISARNTDYLAWGTSLISTITDKFRRNVIGVIKQIRRVYNHEEHNKCIQNLCRNTRATVSWWEINIETCGREITHNVCDMNKVYVQIYLVVATVHRFTM
jgi:hypothetical protein